MPLLLANIQPERSITADWTMDDLTYNQGIHGAQDQANALVRAGPPVLGHHRRLALGRSSRAAFDDWARAAQAVTALRRTRIALLGYPMNGMGDILPRPPRCCAGSARWSSPRTSAGWSRGSTRSPTTTSRRHRADTRALRGREPTCRASATPTRRGWSSRSGRCCEDRGYAGFSFHFDSFGGDGRFQQLPLLAAST